MLRFQTVLVLLITAISFSEPAEAQARAAVEAAARGDCAALGEALNKGMDQNEAAAYKLAGTVYESSGCVSNDMTRAIAFYKKAVDLGDRGVAKRLGLIYATGTGVSQNYLTAAHWYALSCEPQSEQPSQKPASPCAKTEGEDRKVRQMEAYTRALEDLVRLKAYEYPPAALREEVYGAIALRISMRDGSTSVRAIKVNRMPQILVSYLERVVNESKQRLPAPELVETAGHKFVEIEFVYKLTD
jgi:TPR repeat protein